MAVKKEKPLLHSAPGGAQNTRQLHGLYNTGNTPSSNQLVGAAVMPNKSITRREGPVYSVQSKSDGPIITDPGITNPGPGKEDGPILDRGPGITNPGPTTPDYPPGPPWFMGTPEDWYLSPQNPNGPNFNDGGIDFGPFPPDTPTPTPSPQPTPTPTPTPDPTLPPRPTNPQPSNPGIQMPTPDPNPVVQGQTIANPTTLTDWTPGENLPPSMVGPGDLGGSISYGTINRGQIAGDRTFTNVIDPRVPLAGIVNPAFAQVGADQVTNPTDPRFQMDANRQAAYTTGITSGGVSVDEINPARMLDARIGEGAAGSEQAATQMSTDPASAAVAALGDLPPEAMVQSQMEELTKELSNTGEVPAWAKPAADAVEAQLAARGLSRSSVGQAALSNAIIQAALPMAQQNAQAITQNFAQDKQNQQQVNLQNAQASTQFQMQSLSNEQQMAIQNSNLRQQAMLSDQASLNAARQFNASSQNQVNTFMSNLRANINTQNAQRADAMTQFNVGQANAMQQFNANLRYNSEKFNAENATLIDQSNVNWRRQVNTVNTATQNQANQINAQNAFNLTNEALNNMWQEMRDTATWAFESSENDKRLASALAIETLKAQTQLQSDSNSADAAAYAALGSAVFSFLGEIDW